MHSPPSPVEQLLVYDEAGRLAVAQDHDQTATYRWLDGDSPKLKGAESGGDGHVDKRLVARKR